MRNHVNNDDCYSFKIFEFIFNRINRKISENEFQQQLSRIIIYSFHHLENGAFKIFNSTTIYNWSTF